MVNKASAFELDALDSRIKELVAYARERDGEDRTALFRNLVDLFLTGKAPKIDPTRSQLLDVLQALIPHVEADARRTACELVANMSSPPADLVMRLAQDRASLVANLLVHVAFDDDELIELIEKTGREHHQVIASREDLSANIWIALARAAPSAPPFDHNSTLALWSEDLGITQTKAPTAAANTGNVDKQSATITPLHPGRTKTGATIRILQTDEDLVASRNHAAAPKPAEPASTKAVSKTQPERKDQLIQESHAYTAEDTVTDTALIRKHAQDPGPGGWSWISDRDGLVTSISAQGHALLGEKYSSIGASMLDLLGLNTKLGHPVARAFQRRSAIHDAPIFLSVLEDKNQHWTLEATPFFSSPGGIFEGYEGVLTPVAALADETSYIPGNDDVTALFLDELTAPATTGKATLAPSSMPASFTEQASVFQAVIQEGTHTADTLKPTRQALEEIAADMSAPIHPVKTTKAPVTQTSDSGVSSGSGTRPVSSSKASHDNLSKTAAMVVKEVLAEALAPLEATISDALKPRHTKAAEKEPNQMTAADTPPPAAKKTAQTTPAAPSKTDMASKDVSAHIKATFDLLENALGRLVEAGKASEDPQVRLQNEIASACIRSLKDHIK